MLLNIIFISALTSHNFTRISGQLVCLLPQNPRTPMPERSESVRRQLEHLSSEPVLHPVSSLLRSTGSALHTTLPAFLHQPIIDGMRFHQGNVRPYRRIILPVCRTQPLHRTVPNTRIDHLASVLIPLHAEQPDPSCFRPYEQLIPPFSRMQRNQLPCIHRAFCTKRPFAHQFPSICISASACFCVCSPVQFLFLSFHTSIAFSGFPCAGSHVIL